MPTASPVLTDQTTSHAPSRRVMYARPVGPQISAAGPLRNGNPERHTARPPSPTTKPRSRGPSAVPQAWSGTRRGRGGLCGTRRAAPSGPASQRAARRRAESGRSRQIASDCANPCIDVGISTASRSHGALRALTIAPESVGGNAVLARVVRPSGCRRECRERRSRPPVATTPCR